MQYNKPQNACTHLYIEYRHNITRNRVGICVQYNIQGTNIVCGAGTIAVCILCNYAIMHFEHQNCEYHEVSYI